MNITKKKRKKWPYLAVFFVGLLILLYPLVSQYYYRIESQKQLVEFEKSVNSMDESEIIKRMDLARAYNAVLDPTRLADPYTDKEKEGIAEYARMLEIEEKLGFIEIPSIDCKIPMYAGTKESVLQKGAGHLEGTSLPIGGESTHTVITAHRGLPTAELFTQLDKVKKGDVFYIHNIENVLAYEVDQILTVDPSDFDPVMIQEGEDYATLLTCTPYMVNSHRLLVRGHRIPYVAPIDDGIAISKSANDRYKDYIVFEILIASVLAVMVIYLRQDAMKKKKQYLELERNTNIIGYVLIIIGICLPLYLLTKLSLSFTENKRAYEQYLSHEVDPETKQQEQEKIKAYNDSLVGKSVSVVDPFATNEFQRDYQISEDPDAIFAYINIPSLDILEPIRLDASERHLLMGTAHIDGTSLPVGGVNNRSVIAGHRGYYENFMFWSIGELQPGDNIYIERNDEELVYQVVDKEIIDPSEWDKLAPVEGKDMLTLLTCEPFLPPRYKRLLVNCERRYPKKDVEQVNSSDGAGANELATPVKEKTLIHNNARILRNVIWAATAFGWLLLLGVFKNFYQYMK